MSCVRAQGLAVGKRKRWWRSLYQTDVYHRRWRHTEWERDPSLVLTSQQGGGMRRSGRNSGGFSPCYWRPSSFYPTARTHTHTKSPRRDGGEGEIFQSFFLVSYFYFSFYFILKLTHKSEPLGPPAEQYADIEYTVQRIGLCILYEWNFLLVFWKRENCQLFFSRHFKSGIFFIYFSICCCIRKLKKTEERKVWV